MLMVIFGAGASFDSCPTYLPGAQVPMSGDQARLNKLYRPPLANELFENRPLFAEAIDRFPECRTIGRWPLQRGACSRRVHLQGVDGRVCSGVPGRPTLAPVPPGDMWGMSRTRRRHQKSPLAWDFRFFFSDRHVRIYISPRALLSPPVPVSL